MLYTVRPISDRTAFTGRHKDAAFKAAWSDTELLLERELRQLRGSSVVLELDLRESEIRIDGRPYARARAATPAARLAFDSVHGPLTYATDRFWNWQDNVRAIALGLEALRKVDRYGITKRGEQYTGWKALPAGQAVPASHMTSLSALALLVEITGEEVPPVDNLIGREALLRRAKGKAHPDRNGGDRTRWDQVEQAARALGLGR